MKVTRILGLVLALTFCGAVGYAADCASVDTTKRFDAFFNEKGADGKPIMELMGVISASVDPGEGEILTSEIRRPDQMGQTTGIKELEGTTQEAQLDAAKKTAAEQAAAEAEGKKIPNNPRMSVGIWIPFIEPPPVARLKNNQLDGTKAKIFLAKPTSDFKYVVKALVDVPAYGITKDKFYVFKDVKYTWKFEKTAIDTGDKSNADGTSGVEPWTPFLGFNKVVEEAKDFLPKFGADQNPSLSEPKCYANHHTTAYDTGISSVQSTSESNMLQAVMMTLSYKMAEVEGTATGNGYPEGDSATSDSSAGGGISINGEFEIATGKLPTTGSFTEKILKNTVPPAFKDVKEPAVKDGPAPKLIWPDVMGEGTAYKLMYVEDYKEPDTPPVPYTGGDSAGQHFYKAVAGGTIDRDVQITYAMANANLNNAKSDEAGAKLKYYIGNGDIYRVENPFFGNNSYASYDKPYLNFFFMAGNEKFGPYTCPVPRPKILEWYTKRHPYWKDQPGDKTIAFVNEKLRNAFPSDSLPRWQMGLVFYLLNTDGGGANSIPLTKELNLSWMAGTLATNTYFNEYYNIVKEVAGNNPAAAEALKCLDALKDFIVNPQASLPEKFRPPTAFGGRPAHTVTVTMTMSTGEPKTLTKAVPVIPDQPYRTFLRFALCGYDPLQGSFCVGPQDLEKNNPAVVFEWVENVGAADDKAAEVKAGELTIHKDRMIQPTAYSEDSEDACSTDCYGTKQTVSVSVGGCCGAITTVTPGVESNRKGTDIQDTAGGVSLPVPQLSIDDSGGQTTVGVPSNFELKDGETLIVTDKGTNQPVGNGSNGNAGQYSPNTYPGEFNMTAYKFAIKNNTTGEIKPVSFSEESGPGDMVVNEDERITITTGGYDNIDRGSKSMGVGKAELKIFNTQTNQYETLEYVSPDQTKTVDTKITVQPKPADLVSYNYNGKTFQAAFNFDPKIQVYHIFRDPGTYKAEYTVWESAATKKFRTLTFNIVVKDIKQQNKSLENKSNRQ